MNTRIIGISMLLFAATIAFGGIGETDLVTEDATASCTYMDEFGCLEDHTCEPARSLVEKATGTPTACLM